jgi:Xaa-Pro aminopeptidase
MVMTVEPGIYISDSRKVPARWRNIGVRIEDDVALTSNGPDILTASLVKEPDAIEKLMAA